MSDPRSPTGVLLVGSIPLPTPEEVFSTIPAAIPGRVLYLPDGEPDERNHYIIWQRDRFPVEARRFNPVTGGVELPENHSGFTKESIPPTGYDDAACESYKKFEAMQKKGLVPPEMRFQVSLPTPYDCISLYLRDEHHAELGGLYEERMRESVTKILQTIPAEKLAIQWDMAVLPTAMELQKGRTGRYMEFFKPPMEPLKEQFITKHVAPFCDMIPAEVPVGLHICYGDLEHQHHIQPEDTGILVDIAQTSLKAIKRQIQWVHMPIPQSRDDRAYFDPMRDLDTGGAKLYLGLVHPNDEEGTKKRIAMAQSVVSDFGVATECGMGRFSMDEMNSLLQISRDVTAPVRN